MSKRYGREINGYAYHIRFEFGCFDHEIIGMGLKNLLVRAALHSLRTSCEMHACSCGVARQRSWQPVAAAPCLNSATLLRAFTLLTFLTPLLVSFRAPRPQMVVVVIALCTLIFLPTFISILAVFTVVCIDLQLLAVMSLAGLNFNSISCISLLIALG